MNYVKLTDKKLLEHYDMLQRLRKPVPLALVKEVQERFPKMYVHDSKTIIHS